MVGPDPRRVRDRRRRLTASGAPPGARTNRKGPMLRRFLPLILVALFAGTAVAVAASHKSHIHRHPTLTGSDPVLAGNTTVQSVSDGGRGVTEAFGYTATVSGTATNLDVYLTSTSGVQLGLYADSNGKPGALLDHGTVTSNTRGWVTVPLTAGAQITAGARYWLAISARTSTSTITYMDDGSGGSNLDYSGSGLTNPYKVTAQWSSNPASVYVGGDTTTTTSSTSSSTSSQTTSTSTTSSTTSTSTTTSSTTTTTGGGGTVQLSAASPIVGQTIQAPAGSTYQWYDESTPIAGATSQAYTVQASDVDHTLAVTVDGTPSSSSGVVVNPCDITDSSSAQAVADVANTANSGKTICLAAGTYTIPSLTVNQAAMTTLQADPTSTTQPTITNAPAVRANNLRIEGFHLGQGLDDNGSGSVNIVGNYYHDVDPGGALWYSSTSDTPGTVQELHNRMINVRINNTSFNDGWGMYGCSVNGLHYVQAYNTFNTMNQHPLQLSGCASISLIGNEYLNIWDQYPSQHADCVEVWGGAGATLIQDNRCVTQAPLPDCTGGTCGSDMLLSGDSGPFTVVNNLVANSPKQCVDDTPNGTYNGSMRNGLIEYNTVTNCQFGEWDMTGGSSSGNTVEFNIMSVTGNGSCAQFTLEDFNNGAEPGCPGSNDTNVTPAFLSTEPSDPNATYATSNVNPAWGYHPARVGFDAHLP